MLRLNLGCVTCKAKRLKCDEEKPTCQQCHKRQVECGGYKKDFKWRAFEEATFTTKPTSPKFKKSTVIRPGDGESLSNGSCPDSASTTPLKANPQSPASSEASGRTVSNGTFLPQPVYQYPLPHLNSLDTQCAQLGFSAPPPTFPIQSNNFPYQGLPSPVYHDNTARLDTPSTINSAFDDGSTQQSSLTTDTSYTSGKSPRLVDLLIPGSDLHAPPPPEYVDFQTQQELQYQPGGMYNGQAEPPDSMQDDGIEEIPRQLGPAESWIMRLPSPSATDSSSSSEDSIFDALNGIYHQPKLSPASPEMLMMGFDQQTCGILSVKDGPTENPWRTMLWPLARESPALYHAISSMSAFHHSKQRPGLRVEGIEHMRQSIQHFRRGLNTMQTDTALATTLVLAFSESWDQHISTGIEHLRGAKVLVSQALALQRRNVLSVEDNERLRFLCNTWVYMDVIARLTSVDDDDSNDFDAALTVARGPFSASDEIDPLMGCASTMFPLIGRVANLVRKVMKCPSNSVSIVSQANELKEAIEGWQPPPVFQAPEDPTCEIQHSLQTAEAYRWATLLYLHQAVPEIPSMTATELAKKVLLYLATVPLSSRAIIVHIYPLLAAGCEAEGHEERAWVEDRWAAMVRRMLIGNLDRCWEVIKEVWDRRDADEADKCRQRHRRAALRLSTGFSTPNERLKRKFKEEDDVACVDWMKNSGGGKRRGANDMISPSPSSARSPRPRKRSFDMLEDIDFAKTVRGRLHWVGVMKDWNWEGTSVPVFCQSIATDCGKFYLASIALIPLVFGGITTSRFRQTGSPPNHPICPD